MARCVCIMYMLCSFIFCKAKAIILYRLKYVPRLRGLIFHVPLSDEVTLVFCQEPDIVLMISFVVLSLAYNLA